MDEAIEIIEYLESVNGSIWRARDDKSEMIRILRKISAELEKMAQEIEKKS